MEVDNPKVSPRDQVQQLLDAEDLVPVHKPTVIDVCSLQETLANVLAQDMSALFFEENFGHNFLIESHIDYQVYTDVNVLPKWPTMSAALGTAPDTLQLRFRETQQKSFIICSRLDNEVKRPLQAKFPGMLNAHFKGGPNTCLCSCEHVKLLK